jgi:hypothetical protein
MPASPLSKDERQKTKDETHGGMQMKISNLRFPISNFVLVMLVGLMLCFAGGCQDLAQQQAQAKQLADLSSQASAAAADTKAALDLAKATAVATTQAAGTQAAGTQPGAAVPQSAAVKTANAVITATDKVEPVLSKIATVADSLNQTALAYQQQLANAKTQQDQQTATLTALIDAGGKIAQVATPPQYAPLIALAQILGTTIVGLFLVHKGAQTANTAITTPGTTLPAGSNSVPIVATTSPSLVAVPIAPAAGGVPTIAANGTH